MFLIHEILIIVIEPKAEKYGTPRIDCITATGL